MHFNVFFGTYKYRDELIVISLIVIVSLFYGYAEIIQKGPYSMHMWRQCDCLSFTSNYYHEDIGFFEPGIHWSGSTGDGKTVSEFPGLYFLNAQLWKLFGQKEFIYRLLNILIVFCGLFCLFKTFKKRLNNSYWSILSVLFLFSSPVLVYYTNNFLSDAPALGFVLIGFFFLWEYYSKFKLKFLYVSCLFFLLAGLLKLTALLGLLAILPIHLFLLFFDKDRKVNFVSLLPFLILFSILLAWYIFAIKYNNENISGVFLQGVLPIWNINSIQIHDIYLFLKNDLLPAFFNKKALLFVIILWLFSALHYKSVNKLLLFYSLFIFIGTFGFLLLFYQVFTVHDYYLTNLLINIPVILLMVLDLFKKKYPDFLDNKLVKIGFLIPVLYLMILTAQINRQKYFSYNDDFIVKHGLLKTDENREWYHWNYKNTFKALEEITPYLRQLRIQRTDKVLSIPDYSPNISLYLMDQKGYTDFGFNDVTDQSRIQKYIDKGTNYLIVNDTSVLTKRSYLNDFIDKKMGQYKNVFIYKLK
jgi:hypothetical protein